MNPRGAFRLEPAGRTQDYQTYELRRPATGDFWRKATCEEVDCPYFRQGWATRVPTGSPQARYIDGKRHGRVFVETTDFKDVNEGVREFRFNPGQECFQGGHRVAVERDPIAIVRDGDWRGNPTGRARRHQRLTDWRDDMREHLSHLADIKQKG